MTREETRQEPIQKHMLCHAPSSKIKPGAWQYTSGLLWPFSLPCASVFTLTCLFWFLSCLLSCHVIGWLICHVICHDHFHLIRVSPVISLCIYTPQCFIDTLRSIVSVFCRLNATELVFSVHVFMDIDPDFILALCYSHLWLVLPVYWSSGPVFIFVCIVFWICLPSL